MSRRHRAEKRQVLPDARYGDQVITRFMNQVMYQGKKSVAEQIVYGALDTVATKSKRPAAEVFHEALENVAPSVEVRSRRVGGATYQVPVEVRTTRRQALGIRWIISAARERNEKTMTERLSAELLDASNSRGSAVKKREDVHRMAEAIVYGALDIIEGKTKQNPLGVFEQALDNVMPTIEVRSRRVGGATYQVPVEVRSTRRQALGIRWIISAARERSEKTMTERLSAELLDASNNRGNAVKKREDTHRMAEANRAFSHYRW